MYFHGSPAGKGPCSMWCVAFTRAPYPCKARVVTADEVSHPRWKLLSMTLILLPASSAAICRSNILSASTPNQ